MPQGAPNSSPAQDKSGEKIPAIAYVRYCDHECPFPKQRSMVNVLFHLDRKGDYYFNNILILVFLVPPQQLDTKKAAHTHTLATTVLLGSSQQNAKAE